jgi:hypothetical protein
MSLAMTALLILVEKNNAMQLALHRWFDRHPDLRPARVFPWSPAKAEPR